MSSLLASLLAAAGCTHRDAACGELAPGDSLGRGEVLSSCDGSSSLKMQVDGNLVLYRGPHEPEYAQWATGTNGADGHTAIMQPDGNFVLYTSQGHEPTNALWSTDTHGNAGAHVELGSDGTFAVYDETTELWRSVLGDRDAAGGDDGGGGGGGCTADSDCGPCERCERSTGSCRDRLTC